jgi:ATP-dependent RNA helicase SUPV3L1/SUV3
MTSLTGASGEDFASILRSLGYRMERRPKPQEPKVELAPAVQMSETSAEIPATTVADGDIAAASDADHEVSNEVAHEAVETPVEVALLPAVDLVTVGETEMPASAAVAEPTSEVASAPPAEPTSEAAAAPTTEPISEAASAPPSAEPELVEVWRPARAGRPEGRQQRRPRFKRRDAGHGTPHGTPHGTAKEAPQQASDAPNAAVAENAPQGEQQAGASEEKKPGQHQRHHQRPRSEQRFNRRPQPDRDRPSRDRDRDRSSGKPARFERHEKAPDPNSPFAKLAALKAQLEADAKERR